MKAKVRKIVEKYDSDKSFLVPILRDVRKEPNYLPKEALNAVGYELDIPISRIYEVATFYKAFSLKPRGRYQISLCLGTACHVRRAPLVQNHIERVLDLKTGETSPEPEFTFETVNCPGVCALGPVPVVNEAYHGEITISKTNKILKKLGKKAETDDEED